jgi:sugar lactone lactonase YvrE
MIRALLKLPRGPRLLVFFLIFGGSLALLIGLTALLSFQAINPGGRAQAVALTDEVTVGEFAALPDNDAYPPAVAVAPDGTVYTGSFATGAVWAIDTSGTVTEIPNTRENIGSVVGLTVAPDGTLYIVDGVDTDPRTGGGSVKRLLPDGTVADFAQIDDEQGFIAPDDVTVDAQGYVYVTDRGRDEVWRFDADGSNGVAWWTPPQIEGVDVYEPTGLAYDPTNDAIVVTESVTNAVYRVSVADDTTETLYEHSNRANPPGFDGVTITPDGTIYVAALAQNGIVRLEGEELVYIAGLFRGASDVDYGSDRLYVANWDQTPLVNPVRLPQLPFALDVIDLSPGE